MHPDLARHTGRYYGKYRGTVVDNADDTMVGAIRVTVPAMFGATLAVWAQPCFPSGQFFVPPVGAFVWVEFEGGDRQSPIWVGTFHPTNAAPPETQVKPPDNRVVHTPGGHTVEFDDTDGAERIVIRHASNAFVAIDQAGSVTIANKNGSTVSLSAADGGNAMLMSEHGQIVTLTDAGIVLMNKDGAALDLTGNTVRITAKQIILDGTTVALGNGAAKSGQPTLMGTAFQALWTQFLLHTHPTAMGPTLPPVPPAPLVPAVHLSGAVLVA
ncbi:phage baseplate assembly protein V [Sphingomonas faeni]|uniref:phage baseplate assembly protein V n=1 Tax=Sphingomonas faeni TaxID=185950 RepID=UPI003359DF49